MATVTATNAGSRSKASVSDYLDREWAAEQTGGLNAEYVHGEIREMAGADWQHNVIAANLNTAIGPQLRGKPFAICGSQMRVRVSENGPFYYPDLCLSPVPPTIVRDRGESLVNPVVVFEVISPSTEGIDRGEKLANYGRIRSIADYVIVAPGVARVDHYSRQRDGSWRTVILEGVGETLSIDSIGVRLPLEEVYAHILSN